MTRHRILYIHHGYGIGGATLSLLYLIQQLDRSRYEPTVLCLHDGPAATLYRHENIPTFTDPSITDFSHTTLDSVTLSRLWRLPLRLIRVYPSARRVAAFLKEHPTDLVHLNSSTLVPAAIGAHMVGVPIVWHIREPIAHGYLGLRRAWLRRLIHRYANRVIAICYDNAQQLVPSDRIRVVYNFVDFSLFDRRISGATFKRELGLGPDAQIVLMLGGVAIPKGTRHFVQALPLARLRFSNLHFVIAGSVPALESSFRGRMSRIQAYYRHIRQFVAAHNLEGCIHFVGVRRDVPQLLRACDVLAFPSIVPHFARPIIEAGAMAKPVVASNLGGPDELVVQGKTGLLVPPSDPDALAEAIVKILSNPDLARRMGEAGYDQARRLFDAQTNVSATCAVYDEILRER